MLFLIGFLVLVAGIIVLWFQEGRTRREPAPEEETGPPAGELPQDYPDPGPAGADAFRGYGGAGDVPGS
jgi:hypothetical protein